MFLRKLLLSLFAAALLLAANLRVAYCVSVGEETLPGVFTAAQLETGRAAAAAAAEEIARGEAGLPAAAAVPVLTLGPGDGDETGLACALLDETAGVSRGWTVLVNDAPAGLVGDPTALGEVLEAIVAEGAVYGAVTAGFSDEIALRGVYIPEGQEDDLMAVARAIRDMTEVVSVTADGVVRVG